LGNGFPRRGSPRRSFARAQNSDGYQALLAQLLEAEIRGFDSRDDLSTLVNIRSLDDASDVSAILTNRVSRYVATMGYSELSSTQLIAGLIPRATGIADPDIASALRDRADAIEERARYLAAETISRATAGSINSAKFLRSVSIWNCGSERWSLARCISNSEELRTWPPLGTST
jgi:hypothetical protein